MMSLLSGRWQCWQCLFIWFTTCGPQTVKKLSVPVPRPPHEPMRVRNCNLEIRLQIKLIKSTEQESRQFVLQDCNSKAGGCVKQLTDINLSVHHGGLYAVSSLNNKAAS